MLTVNTRCLHGMFLSHPISLFPTFSSITLLSPSLPLICVMVFVLYSGYYKAVAKIHRETHIHVCDALTAGGKFHNVAAIMAY